MRKEDREWLEQLLNENKESDTELTYTYCPFRVLYQLVGENKELHNKIDKAIEYIEENAIDENGDIGINFYANNTYELLEILKDSDVDE